MCGILFSLLYRFLCTGTQGQNHIYGRKLNRSLFNPAYNLYFSIKTDVGFRGNCNVEFSLQSPNFVIEYLGLWRLRFE